MTARFISAVCIGGFLSLLSAPTPCKADQKIPPRFQTAVFRTEGDIFDCVPSDMNQDGRCDFVVAHGSASGRDGRFLSVYIQRECGFRGIADFVLPFGNHEMAFQIIDMDEDSVPELVSLADRGVFARDWRDSAGFINPRLLVASASVFPRADPGRIIQWPIAQDLDADGVREILLPQSECMEVYCPGLTGEYALSRSLWISPDYAFSETVNPSYSIQLPRLVIRDFNADGIPDLFFVRDSRSGNRLDVFIQQRGKPILASGLIPPDCRFDFNSPDAFGIPNPSGKKPYTTLEIEDLNGDGRADAIEARDSKILRIHLNRRGRFGPVPDFVLQADQFSFGYAIRDFNDDGLADLGFIELNTGLKSLTQFLFAQKYRRVFKGFLSRPDSAYSKTPDMQIPFIQKFLLRDPSGKNSFVSFDGDFTGDGIQDMAVVSAPDAVQIYQGLAKGGFYEKPAITLHASISNHYRITDVNRDGVSDIFFWHADKSAPTGRLTLLLSSISE